MPRSLVNSRENKLRDALLACANGQPKSAKSAADIIRRLGPGAIARTLDAVEPGVEELRAWRRYSILSSVAAGALGSVLTMAAMWLKLQSMPQQAGSQLFGDLVAMSLSLVPSSGIFFGIAWNLAISYIRAHRLTTTSPSQAVQLRQGALFALAALGTPETIGALLIFSRGNPGVSDHAVEAARRGLLRTLEKLKPEDGPMLSPDERDALYKLLHDHTSFLFHVPGRKVQFTNVARSEDDVPMSRALIRAYTVVGDARAADRIDRITTIEPKTRDAELVADTAKWALEAARERAEWDREQMENTLLRPAEKANDTLLRPVTYSGSEPPEQLLRPTTSGSNDHDA